MGIHVISGISVKLDADDRVFIKRADLLKSTDEALRQLAAADLRGTHDSVRADGDRDGWISQEELTRASGLYVSTDSAYHELVRAARRRQFHATSIVTLRQNPKAIPTTPAPLPVAKERSAELERSAFVPLAGFLAHRFAHADSYESSYGDGTDRIYHFGADELVARFGVDALAAAAAILTCREGVEIGLSRNGRGQYVLVQGIPDKVEFDSELTGFDVVFHTHPLPGARSAQPSTGDLSMTRAYDPDKRGAAVSEDGFWIDYGINANGGVDRGDARRLWRTTEPG